MPVYKCIACPIWCVGRPNWACDSNTPGRQAAGRDVARSPCLARPVARQRGWARPRGAPHRHLLVRLRCLMERCPSSTGAEICADDGAQPEKFLGGAPCSRCCSPPSAPMAQTRARLCCSGPASWMKPTEDEAEPDPEPGPEADMDEPDDAEPTAAEYDEFFNSILAM